MKFAGDIVKCNSEANLKQRPLVGTANNEEGQASCMECLPGSNALQPGMTQCQQCSGAHQYTTGPDVACLECPNKRVTVAIPRE